MDLNSFKNNFALVSASEDISQINNSLATLNHCKMDNQLLPDVHELPGIYFPFPRKLAFAKIAYDKAILISIIKQLEKKIGLPLYELKSKCKKIKNFHAFSAALRDLSKALSHVMGPSVTTRRSSSLATKKTVANYSNMKNRIKNLESELQMEKRNSKLILARWIKLEEELKITKENAKVCNADLKKELQKKEAESIIQNEMFSNLREMAINKKKELGMSLTLYRILVKYLKNERAQGCEECRTLKKKREEMDTVYASFENQIMRLNSSIRDHENKDECSRNEIKALKKQVEELEEKLFEASVTPKMAAENYAIASSLFAKKTPDHPKKEDLDPKRKEEKKKECVINYNHYAQNRKKVYDEPSTSSSMLGSCSIRNRSFQTMNANDYFSARSLLELYNDHTQKDADEESELTFPVKKCKISETAAVSIRTAAWKQLTEGKKVTKKKTDATSPSAQPLPDSATSMMITEYPQRVSPLKISMKMQQLTRMRHQY